jgi:tetratricopeptide (TPR) repeat protein
MSGTTAVRAAARAGWESAARSNPAPTVAYFEELLAAHPTEPLALYHAARAHDYAGEPQLAAPLYERAFAAGLSGDELRRGLTSYASTLRNLGRAPEAVSVLLSAASQFPADVLVRCYLALALHSAGRTGDSLATMLEAVLGALADPELQANRWALANYAAALRTGAWTPDGGAALGIPTPS